jgi:subtilisin family serine protease
MKRNICCLLGLLFVVSCRDYSEYEKVENKIPANQTFLNEEYMEGWVRVKFNRETGDNIRLVTGEDGVIQTGVAEIDEMMTRLGVSKIENVFAEGGKFRERRREAGLHLWYDVYTGDTQDHAETRAMNLFGDLPFVDIVELIPVYRQEQSPVEKYINRPYSLAVEAQAQKAQEAVEEAETPYYPFNDPELNLQWHYQNFGDNSGSIAGADVNLFPAWEITGGRPEVIVAVLDGGVDYSHPDLAANMWVNTAELNGTAGVDDDKNGYTDDIYGYRWRYRGNSETSVPESGEILPLDHGTHCAGTIAAVNNNGIGVCGVAGGTGKGDGVRIISCQIYVPDKSSPDPYGNTFSTEKAPDAFAYAADNGAVIASCSWSSSSNSSYKTAVDYFIKNAGTDGNGKQTGPMKGGLVVCAAGNQGGESKRYPAAYAPCVSVGGIRWDYIKAANSNYGDWITLSAPYGGGEGTNSSIYSTYPTQSPNGYPAGSGYGYKSGTSQACPHVAGIAALIVSRYGEPGFTPDEVKDLLQSTTRNINSYLGDYAEKLGTGLVNAYAALSKKSNLKTITDLNGVWDTYSVALTWTDPNDASTKTASEYDIYWSLNPLTESSSGLPTGAGVNKERINNTWEAGASRAYAITGLRSDCEYHIAVVAVNSSENSRSEMSNILSGRTQSVPDAVVDLAAVNGLNVIWSDFSAELTWSDPNTSGVSGYDIFWSHHSLESISPGNPPTEVNKVRINNTDASGGQRKYMITGLEPDSEYDVGVIAVNSSENSRSEMSRLNGRTLALIGNLPPVMRENKDNKIYFEEFNNITVNVNDYFYDPDGDPLRFKVAVSSDEGRMKATVNGTQLYLNAISAGDCKITVLVADSNNAQVTGTLITMARDAKKEVDIYPNPATDKLQIRMGKEVDGEVRVQLFNSAGVKVMDTNVVVRPFEPGTIAVGKLSSGVYTLVIKHNGKEIKRNILKY